MELDLKKQVFIFSQICRFVGPRNFGAALAFATEGNVYFLHQSRPNVRPQKMTPHK